MTLLGDRKHRRRPDRAGARLRADLASGREDRLLAHPAGADDRPHAPRAQLRPSRRARLKQSSTSDLSIGGADLARQALVAGLVDECQVFLGPMAIGGGNPDFPLGVRIRLELLDEHRFSGGTVCLRYAVLPAEKSTI